MRRETPNHYSNQEHDEVYNKNRDQSLGHRVKTVKTVVYAVPGKAGAKKNLHWRTQWIIVVGSSSQIASGDIHFCCHQSSFQANILYFSPQVVTFLFFLFILVGKLLLHFKIFVVLRYCIYHHYFH